jgi:UDP-N-acetylglucosamine transferase subunit ALG13
MQGQHLRIFVATGHSEAFTRLLEAARRMAQRSEWELFVQRGAGAEFYADLPGAAFITREEFAARLDWADVVIAQGGAGSLYEAWCWGHTPIAVPRLSRFSEHVDDHQLFMTRAFGEQGKVLVCEDISELEQRVAEVPARQAPRREQLTPLTQAVAEALAARKKPSRQWSGRGFLRDLWEHVHRDDVRRD